MMLRVLLLALVAASTCSEDCKCDDASQAWGGVAYHCRGCRAVPQTLPVGLTFLGLDEYEGANLTASDLHRYQDTLKEVKVELSRTRRGGVGVHAFQALRGLVSVYLVGNDLRHFPHLPQSIQVVEMQENQLGVLPDMYQPNLLEMMLDTNRVAQLPGIFIAPKLTTLSLYDNLLTSVDLRQLPALSLIDLGVNRLREFPKLPKSVIIAKLQFNKISTIPKLDLPNLKQLDLSNNNISHIENDTFKNCPMLQLIKLNGNPIKYIAPSDKKRLKRLQECDLPDGMTLDTTSQSTWIFVYIVVGLCVVAIILTLTYFVARSARRRGYVRPQKVWHVDLRTPIYRAKRGQAAYKQLANDAL